jgi:aminopeptidase
MKDPRLERMAELLTGYCAGVKKGDFVLVEGEYSAIPWMVEVVKAALRLGAHVETRIGAAEVIEAILKTSTAEQLEDGLFISEQVMKRIDVWLTSFCTSNTKAFAGVDPDKLKHRARGASAWRKTYMDRMADGSLRWCGTQFPALADAQEAGMSLSDYEDFVYRACFLDRDDPVAAWKALSAGQEKWVRFLDGKKELRILSKGTDITVGVAGRKWINCDGKLNFPDGEIFTSPVEDAIEGRITFSFPGIYMGKEIEGIWLEVAKGRVVKAGAERGESLLHALLDTDEGARGFGEVAIGTNYGIGTFTRNMLFDEKIGGTVHMAIGHSVGDAGGRNESSIHWDMLCDMRTGGEILADGRLFYKDGLFIESAIP